MRFESYAQEWEDLILYIALQDVKKGFYIDVGANDPVHMNVTKAFYDRGWNGINIEPLRTKCMLLQNERARDINLCVGIGSKREKLFLTAADLASSFSTNIVEKSEMKNRNKYIKAILTLTDVYEQYCGSGQQVHFCKIDVEDYEKEVLGGSRIGMHSDLGYLW